MNNNTAQSVIFDDLFDKPLKAVFDQADSSSDGGGVLLKACDKNLGLIDAISKRIMSLEPELEPYSHNDSYGCRLT